MSFEAMAADVVAWLDAQGLGKVGLLGHSMVVDQRINRILEQLEKMGVTVEEERATADKFDPNYLNKIVD